MFLKVLNKGIFHNFKFWFLLIIVYYLFSSSVYAIASLVKHSHYETFIDLAVFNQGIWQYSQLQWPQITLHLDRSFLGDHFHPILILLTPIYWIYHSEKTLLFLQPFIMLSAIIPLFLTGVRLTKSFFFSFCIVFAYSLYIPLQYTLFYDFHEIIFLPPLFAWTYFFYILKNIKITFFFLLLLLLVKEEVGFFVGTFGLYILLTNKEWRKFGAFWVIAGSIYSLLMMYIIIPKIGGSYLYFNYGSSGDTPLQVIGNFLKNPLTFLSLFSDSPLKKETFYRTFWPFGFLSLFSPLGILLSAEQFFSRFIDLKTITRWTIGYHYSAPMTIIVAISTVWSVHFYTQFIKQKKTVIVLLGILILFLTRAEQINASAVLMIKNPIFWERSSWMDDIDRAIKLIPNDGIVATQNNIVAHLSSRKSIYLLKDIEKAEYILTDFHSGQSDYNFYSQEQKEFYRQVVKDKISSGKYQILYNNSDVSLIKKI